MLKHKLSTLALAVASVASLQLFSSITSPIPSSSFVNIGFIAPVLANTPKYVPPHRGTPRRTAGGGSRGCLKSIPVSLNLLVPNNHIGQTASDRPTFSWHVSIPTSVSVPMQFALVEPGVAQPLLTKSLQVNKTGLVQLEFPQDAPPMQLGHKYRWTVSVTCNAQRPSENVYARGWVKRVTTTANQAKAITAAGSDKERAMIYAQAGLWYDALDAMSKAHRANPQDPSNSESFISLLNQAGLTQIVSEHFVSNTER